MKGFFEWFKSSSKMKRWMFLTLLGVISVCYAISKILVTNKLESLKDISIIVAAFVVGFLAMIIGFVYMQKRTLEMLVEKTDQREENNLNSLIFNRKVYSQGPKIVVIGGGAGLNTVLKGLKKYTDNLTAIVTVSDYGEKTTDSRKLLKTLPLDDIKESMVALSSNDNEMEQLLNYKFDEGKLESLSFGDIYLLAMQKVYKDFEKSVKQSSEILNITGRVLPVTMEEMKICAELEDGTVVESRDQIPEMVNKKSSKINRIFINPTNCKAAPGVVEAIEEADAIIIGPGNLYTNVIPNLLVTGVARAMRNAKGFKIYISNIMTDPGQTHEYSLSDHIKAIIDHVGEGVVDYCIYDTGEVVPEFIRKYNMEGADLVEQDIAKAKTLGVHLLKRDLATVDSERIRHNPDAIAASIVELICEDMKFKDMQNNPEYMFLNDTLQYKKKKMRARKKGKLDENGEVSLEKKDSKFKNKYDERINSIKNCDENIKQKRANVGLKFENPLFKRASNKELQEKKNDSRIVEKSVSISAKKLENEINNRFGIENKEILSKEKATTARKTTAAKAASVTKNAINAERKTSSTATKKASVVKKVGSKTTEEKAKSTVAKRASQEVKKTTKSTVAKHAAPAKKIPLKKQ